MRRTVGWSSMTRILGALRTSGRVTVAVAAKTSIRLSGTLARWGVPPDRGPARPGYYTQLGIPVIVMRITRSY